MRCGKGLVQIEVQHVNPQITRAGDTHQGIQVCPVAVDQTAAVMDGLANLQYVLFKQSQRIRIGQHQSDDRVIALLLQGFQVNVAALVRRQLDNCVTAHGGRSRIGTVS